MKLLKVSLVFIAFAAGSANGVEDPDPAVVDVALIHEQADLLLKERNARKNPRIAEEAAGLLQEALKAEPENPGTLSRLGLIYSIILGRHAEGIQYLKAGANLGDLESLEGLALAFLAVKDFAGLAEHRNLFVANYERLRGDTKAIIIALAVDNRDAGLFRELLLKTREEEIKESPFLARSIASLAKLLAGD